MSAQFHSGVLLAGLNVVAVRLDDGFIVREVAGDWLDVPVGDDARDVIPALVGMEDVLSSEEPHLALPFVTVGEDESVAASISACRDAKSGALWILLRDVADEAAMHQRLVQQHNALSLAHTELAAARDAALAADRAKTVFLANVSHELRTPLNVIIGGAAILLKERETPLPREDLEAFSRDIHDSGELLLQLVNDLIDLSRAETGNLALYEEWCSVSAIASDIVRMIRALPKADGIDIADATEDALPEFFADQTRIKQILLNLLANAVNACKPGAHIQVEMARSETGDLRIVVRDDGPGMSPRDLSTALEPFGQVRTSERGQGAGLGLAIVSRLAGLHGGTFNIETAPGEGVAAIVILPASRFAPAIA